MRKEKHGRGVEQAWRMLDLFAGLGTERFDLTRTDIDGHKRSFVAGLRLATLQRWMSSLLESAISQQHNVIVRPRSAPTQLIQLDDLSQTALERVSSAAFLILATSGGNHQAWVAVVDSEPGLARRLRQGSGADVSASGAVRIAGSVNFKRKYGPEFPTVEILKATPNHTVSQAELEALGVVAAVTDNRHTPPARVSFPRSAKAWPSYRRCLQNAPLARNSDRPDVSRADFTFCLLSIDWGWSVEQTCQRLMETSTKAQSSGDAYARLTAQRAAAAVGRRRLISGSLAERT